MNKNSALETDKLLADCTKEQHKTSITKLRNARGDADLTKIK